jgi:F-type H+-transporting ATPase subunit epsilon
MKVSIITPERTLFKDSKATRVTLPTAEGEITVLENHIPLVSFLATGEIVVEDENGITPLAVSGGFLEVEGPNLKILADTAEKVEELDMERAEEARKRAEKLLETKQSSDEDFAFLSAKIEKELTRLRVGKKYKHLQPPNKN